MHHIGMTEVEVLSGPRVTLRAPTLDDAEPLFERIASDPEVSRYMSWNVHPDVGETRRVITELFNVGGETTWLIDLREGTGVIGAIGWRRPQPHIIDFGYYIGRRWWGQGLMSEAVQLVLDKARRDPTVYRVSAYCYRRQHGVGAAAGTQRAHIRRPPGAVCDSAEHQRRTAGLPALRQGGALMVFDLRDLEHPVIVAPMAGGPSTPELAAAGSTAGGLGFVPAGYLTAQVFAERLAAARRLASGPLGANLFVPQASAATADAIERYAAALAPDAERYGATLGEPRFDDDDWAAKIDVLLDLRPEVASFTFGLPSDDECLRLRQAGITTVGTVTTLAEARRRSRVASTCWRRRGRRPAGIAARSTRRPSRRPSRSRNCWPRCAVSGCRSWPRAA